MAKSLATLARQEIAAEKRAAKALHLVARATFKSSGATVYEIRSCEKHYHVTMCAGVVRSCVNVETGNGCEGRQFTGHCKHGDFAVAYAGEHGELEAKKQEQLAMAEQVASALLPEMVRHNDLNAHVDDELASQAEAATREERERKAEKAAKTDPYHYYRVCAMSGVARRYERTPSGSMVPMR